MPVPKPGAPVTASSPEPSQASAQGADEPEILRIWREGRSWDLGVVGVDPAQMHEYAAATNDLADAYYGPDAIAPPMFHVRLMRDLLFGIMEDPGLGLDMLRLLHGEHDATFHRPLRPGDLVHLRGRLSHLEQKAKGLVVEARMVGFVEGSPAVEARTLFFIRGQQVTEVGRGRRAPGPDRSMPEREPDAALRWTVDPDQSHRYAAASLDVNPIHLDPATAQAAGLPDVILHGLCTMAMASKSIVRSECHHQPSQLARLAVRWTRPVFNGSTLTTQLWRTGDKERRFMVVQDDGAPVITHGLAELR